MTISPPVSGRLHKPSVGQPGYLPYCMNCTGLRRMSRGTNAFKCGVCGLRTRKVNGEDMFDQTAPTTPIDTEKSNAD